MLASQCARMGDAGPHPPGVDCSRINRHPGTETAPPAAPLSVTITQPLAVRAAARLRRARASLSRRISMPRRNSILHASLVLLFFILPACNTRDNGANAEPTSTRIAAGQGQHVVDLVEQKLITVRITG